MGRSRTWVKEGMMQRGSQVQPGAKLQFQGEMFALSHSRSLTPSLLSRSSSPVLTLPVIPVFHFLLFLPLTLCPLKNTSFIRVTESFMKPTCTMMVNLASLLPAGKLGSGLWRCPEGCLSVPQSKCPGLFAS